MTRLGLLWDMNDIAKHFGTSWYWVHQRVGWGVFIPVYVDGPRRWFCPDEVKKGTE